ncbi:MAG: histidine kinase,Response regulator receiver domain proteinhistidine kinase [Verrucomicrobiales bacterium]|nr:histidine kinase,Response regulator receiver domain proteinhistidine kinase [Verrucomicrobiales bacterium]
MCVIAVALMFPAFIRSLFSASGFLPHATCYLRNPKMIWLHVTSDLLIGVAYVSISMTLGYMVYKATRSIPFHWMFLAFGTFIISCGFTHFMEVWTVWRPVYWFAGYVKAITAIASAVTAITLIPLVPKVFALIEGVKVSEKRRLDLVQANKELEQLASDLARQKNEFELANQDLQMFTYSVAHDLRGPLRMIQGFSLALMEDYERQLDAEGADLLKRVETGAARMQRLLAELLEYSRVTHAQLPLHPVNLADAIEQSLAAVKPEAEARDARISIKGEPLEVVANTTVVGQVLTNLLSNAIKFVPRDATPNIVVTTESKNDFVRVSVRDNGIGIKPEEQKRIFKIFERVHSKLEYPGTGLGLAIVQRGTEKMGGVVGVDSKPGYGSTFWFELHKV